MHHPHKVSYAGSNPVITTSKLRTALAQSGEHYTVTVEVTGSKPVRCAKHAPVAQLVEHMIEDHGRVGSTPTGCTKYALVAEMD